MALWRASYAFTTFLVEGVLIVETKATKEIDDTDTKQILNYL